MVLCRNGTIPKISRTVAVVLLKMPTVSRELAYATTPHREIMPYDGLKPTVPVYAAGSLTEPPVSVPSELYIFPVSQGNFSWCADYLRIALVASN